MSRGLVGPLTGRIAAAVVGLVLVALATQTTAPPAAAQAKPALPEWVAADYSALIDLRELTHSGEPVGALLRRLGGRPPATAADRQAHSLLEPLLEPYAFVVQDTLDTIHGLPDPPPVEVGFLWQPGERQPAWAALLRARRYLIESDGAGRIRASLPWHGGDRTRGMPTVGSSEAAQAAWDAAWPVLRHVLEAERRRLDSSAGDGGEPVILEITVHPYVHRLARSMFYVGREPLRVEVDDTRPDGRRPPLDLERLQAFFDRGLQLEGARVPETGGLVLLGSESERSPGMLGDPVGPADLAVAYRAVFHGGLSEPYMSLDRGLSPQTSLVSYGGRLQDTTLGLVSLLCDIRFKTFSLGRGIVEGSDLRAALVAEVPDFETHLERFARDPTSQAVLDQQTRLWFYPDNVDLTVSLQGDVLAMRRVRMTAAAERLGDTMTAAGRDDAPWTQATVAMINREYDGLARVFPELADLDQAVRLLALASWMRQAARVGAPLPELDILLALELPAQPTPRTFPVLLTFDALAPPGANSAVEVVDRVVVGEALDRLAPGDGRQLPAALRLRRALSALDPDDTQSKQMMTEVQQLDPGRLDAASLDLLAYRAERLRMHETVLDTVDPALRADLVTRQQQGANLRVFSVGIGGLDLGMDKALARANSGSLRMAGGAVAERSVTVVAPGQGRPAPAQPVTPREAWRTDPDALTGVTLPRHGVALTEETARGQAWIRSGSDGDGKGGTIWTALGADGPDVQSRKVLTDGKRRATRFERTAGNRFWRYRLEGDAATLRAVPVATTAPTTGSFSATTPQAGLVLMQVSASAASASASAGEPETLPVRLDALVGGVPRQLAADFPRAVLQRVVVGPVADPTPGRPPAGLSPLPSAFGDVEALMMLMDRLETEPPWLRESYVVPGEQQAARLARGLAEWWRAEAQPRGVLVGTDPLRSPARWQRAPPPTSTVLLLPADGFPGPAAGLRERIESAWGAGPVLDALPRENASGMVVLVSAEPPGTFARRLRDLANRPELVGRYIAAWSLAGPLRPDLPATLLADGKLAGVGLAASTLVEMRRAAERLGEMSDGLTAPEPVTRVERLPGPFLWYF